MHGKSFLYVLCMGASSALVVGVLVGPVLAVREAQPDKKKDAAAAEPLIEGKLRHTDVPTARPVTYETDAVKRILYTLTSCISILIDTYPIDDQIWFTPRDCEPDVTPHVSGIAIR